MTKGDIYITNGKKKAPWWKVNQKTQLRKITKGKNIIYMSSICRGKYNSQRDYVKSARYTFLLIQMLLSSICLYYLGEGTGTYFAFAGTNCYNPLGRKFRNLYQKAYTCTFSLIQKFLQSKFVKQK